MPMLHDLLLPRNPPSLEDAIALAVVAHGRQVDKQGVAYILHPLRVMLKFGDQVEQMVAVMHDLIEDTMITALDLQRAGYPVAVLNAVVALTKRPGESYAVFIDRVKQDPLAAKVKVADIQDNLARMKRGQGHLSAKYVAALNALGVPRCDIQGPHGFGCSGPLGHGLFVGCGNSRVVW